VSVAAIDHVMSLNLALDRPPRLSGHTVLRTAGRRP
jgi:hypothetical protein